ncbi:MAG: trigger factor, partial [Deltaproteobacteria bacterium]|nr:trigger factor [Deltaproteobacteria bacterium]
EKETLKQGQSFKYSATMDVRPEFELKDYLGLELEKEIYSVSEQDIQTRLEQIREANGRLITIEEDRPVQNDDFVVLDYEGFEDSKPIEGVKASNFLLKVGNNSFYQKFEDSLLGLKKGEEKEFRVDFDEEYYHSKLAGRSVDFKVRIVEIKKRELPELNDEFAKSLDADFKNLDELKEKVRETIEAQEDRRIKSDVKMKLLEKISGSVDFDLPAVLVESELNYAVENVKQNLVRSGSDIEKAGLSDEKLREDFMASSEKRVKEMLILDKIAGDNGIEVTETDLENGFRDMASAMGQPYETVRKFYSSRNLEDSISERLLEEKTLNYLIENAKIVEAKNEIPAEDSRTDKEDK